MEADHVRGEKKFNLGARDVRFGTEKEIRDELAKCDPTCRNCHSLLGWLRRSGLRLSDFAPRSGRWLPPGASLSTWSGTRLPAKAARIPSDRVNSAAQGPPRFTSASREESGLGRQSNGPQAIRGRVLR